MRPILLASLVPALLTGPLEATPRVQPATYCRAADSTSAQLLNELRQIATGTEAPWTTMRDSLEIPAVAADQVSLVTQESSCKTAAERYNLEVVRLYGVTSAPRRVYLIKVGNNYAALDAAYKSPQASWGAMVLMNNSYKFVSAWRK